VPFDPVPDPTVSKLHSDGEHVFGSKKLIRPPPLLLKLKKSPVAVAVTLLLVIATTPLTPEVRVAVPVPSNKVRLKERMFEVPRG